MKENRITKKRLIREVNNDMCHNWYYEYRYRVYADDTHYYKGNFVLWFDAEEVCAFYGKDSVTKKEIAQYADEIGYTFLDNAPTGKKVNADTMRVFRAACNKTIEDYNK